MVVGLLMSAAGCQSTTTSVGSAISSTVVTTNNTLAGLSKYDIPTACGIIAVAEGYFAQEKSKISAKNQLIEAQAAAAVAVICNNPPSNVTTAFVELLSAWTAIQNATQQQ